MSSLTGIQFNTGVQIRISERKSVFPSFPERWEHYLTARKNSVRIY